MKIQPGMQQQAGCMKVLMYVMPLFTALLAFIMPAAVGFYWTAQTLISFIQTLALQKVLQAGRFERQGRGRPYCAAGPGGGQDDALAFGDPGACADKAGGQKIWAHSRRKRKMYRKKKQSAAKNKGTKM